MLSVDTKCRSCPSSIGDVRPEQSWTSAQTTVLGYATYTSGNATYRQSPFGGRSGQSTVSDSVSSSDRKVVSISFGSDIAHTPPPLAPLLPTSLPTRFLPTLPGPRPSHRFVPASWSRYFILSHQRIVSTA